MSSSKQINVSTRHGFVRNSVLTGVAGVDMDLMNHGSKMDESVKQANLRKGLLEGIWTADISVAYGISHSLDKICRGVDRKFQVAQDITSNIQERRLGTYSFIGSPS